jgi:hypothetical protein
MAPILRRVAVLCFFAASVCFPATLTVDGGRFLLDQKPFDMWGIRTASASQNQRMTGHLIAQLDEYKRHGVNTVSVYFMGSSGGYMDPFSPDGASLDAGHLERMRRILDACDERGMVAIVGIFYQRADPPSLRDWEAAGNAVRTVAKALKPHRNAILNIANEQNSANYARLPWARVRNTADVLELCRIARAVDPKRIIGAGGYDHEKNEILGRAAELDVLLFDTNGPGLSSGELFQRFVKAGISKPIVNVETFGGWTSKFLPQGVFPDDVKAVYRREVENAAAHDGLYLHFHNNPWCQAAGGAASRYDLGGDGTAASPGIRWYFEYVKAMSSRAVYR